MIPEHLTRLVVVPSTSSTVRAVAGELSSEIIEVPTVGDMPVPNPEPGDVLVHGFPDLFGRVLSPPVGWNTILVCERIALPFVDSRRPMIEAGPFPTADPPLLAGALRAIYKPIVQQRRVRPVFKLPPLLGLAFVAPNGIKLPGGFGELERPIVAGLPDLVIVRPTGTPPSDIQRFDPPPLVLA